MLILQHLKGDCVYIIIEEIVKGLDNATGMNLGISPWLYSANIMIDNIDEKVENILQDISKSLNFLENCIDDKTKRLARVFVDLIIKCIPE